MTNNGNNSNKDWKDDGNRQTGERPERQPQIPAPTPQGGARPERQEPPDPRKNKK